MKEQPTLVEKEILRIGQWKHPQAPNGILDIDEAYLKEIAENFIKSKNPVPVYRGHRDMKEVEANTDLIIAKNITNLTLKGDALVAQMAIDEKELEKYNDVSASIDPFYTDPETGVMLGKVVDHIAFTMNPYIKDLEGFVKLSNPKHFNILLSARMETKPEETKEEVKTEVKTDEVTTETKPVETKPEETKVETETKETKEETTETSEDVKTQLSQLQAQVINLTKEKNLAEAKEAYNVLLSQGKILPTMKDSYIALSMYGSNRIDLSDGKHTTVKTLVDDMINKLPKLVNLSEKGTIVEQGGAEQDANLISAMKESFMKRNPTATEEQWKEHISDPIAQKEIAKASQKK